MVPAGEPCIECLKDNCCNVLGECWQDEAGCRCVALCLTAGGDPGMCTQECGMVDQSLTFKALICYSGCVQAGACQDPTSSDSTSSATETGSDTGTDTGTDSTATSGSQDSEVSSADSTGETSTTVPE
jgi:hypothetical protein